MRFPFAMAAMRLPGGVERERFANIVSSRRGNVPLTEIDQMAATVIGSVRRSNARAARL